jgi:hypothetical protein
VRAGLDADEADRCCQLLRTVETEAFHEVAPALWAYPVEGEEVEEEPVVEDPKAKKAPPKGKVEEPPPEPEDKDVDEGPLKADGDPGAGALFLSHTWDEPPGWEEHFGGGQSFAAAKQLQASAAVRRAEQRRLPRGEAPRVWVDRASLPQSVTPEDHPLEQTVFGPYLLPVREIKEVFDKVEGPNRGYTVLRVKDKDGHKFEGTMNMRKFDDQGRPSKDSWPMEVSWVIPPGWYHVSSAHVVAEDKISEAMADEKRKFEPRGEQLRRWCTGLGLRNEIWVTITLGSLRCEYLMMIEPMLAMHAGFVPVVAWNYFDRLWPLVEWAVFCARRGADRVQLAATVLAGPVLTEYYRAIKRLNIFDAAIRDDRDRELLLDLIERLFRCDARSKTLGYTVPPPKPPPPPECHVCKCKACMCWAQPHPHPLFKYQGQAMSREPKYEEVTMLQVNNREVKLKRTTVKVKERVVDYSRVERYVRATAIAIFAHEAAMAASGDLGYDDEIGWTALAAELGYSELHSALKKCKPYDWFKLVSIAGLEGEDAEAAYLDKVEAWWTALVLPVLEHERLLAVRKKLSDRR